MQAPSWRALEAIKAVPWRYAAVVHPGVAKKERGILRGSGNSHRAYGLPGVPYACLRSQLLIGATYPLHTPSIAAIAFATEKPRDPTIDDFRERELSIANIVGLVL